MSIPTIAPYTLPPLSAVTPNRVSWQPNAQRAVLLIHDMQQYFLDFFAADVEPMTSIIANLLALRACCDRLGIPVVYTAQPPRQSVMERGLLQDWWGPGITRSPQRAHVIDTLAPRAHDTVLTKWRYSAFARSDLEQRMHAWQRDQLIIGGVYAHIGCMTSAVDAFMRDIQPFFVADAVADFSQQQHLLALDWVAQRCGVVLSADNVLQLLAPATRAPASLAALRDAVAAILEIDASDIQHDDDLMLLGMDSIRAMTLVEQWRDAGVGIEFSDLAQHTTLAGWWAVLNNDSSNTDVLNNNISSNNFKSDKAASHNTQSGQHA